MEPSNTALDSKIFGVVLAQLLSCELLQPVRILGLIPHEEITRHTHCKFTLTHANKFEQKKQQTSAGQASDSFKLTLVSNCLNSG